jgi:translation elongation factor EF-Tu-like GTPase
MGWTFWKTEKSEAELSLERLHAGTAQLTRDRAAAATRSAAAPVAAGDFRMTVEDVFSITGRGTVVTGQVAQGTVRVGLRVTVLTAAGQLPSKVTGIEMFRRIVDSATVGDKVGLLLAQVRGAQVARGDTITG